MLPIVDTHQHLWDLDLFSLPWLDEADALASSYLMSDYLCAVHDHNVVKTVYMEVDVTPNQQRREIEYVTNLCRAPDNPMVAAVISGDPSATDFETYIRSTADSPVTGVRQVLHVPTARPGTCLMPNYVDGLRLLGELQLSFDLCLRPSELGDAVSLVDECPETLFILDHCGNADPNIVAGTTEPEANNPFAHERNQWLDDIAALGVRNNVVCKISGIIARIHPGVWNASDLAPTIDHCLDSFGPDRVIFGGDWPVCTVTATFAAWATALRQIIESRSLEEQRKLLHDNAVRLYRLN